MFIFSFLASFHFSAIFISLVSPPFLVISLLLMCSVLWCWKAGFVAAGASVGSWVTKDALGFSEFTSVAGSFLRSVPGDSHLSRVPARWLCFFSPVLSLWSMKSSYYFRWFSFEWFKNDLASLIYNRQESVPQWPLRSPRPLAPCHLRESVCCSKPRLLLPVTRIMTWLSRWKRYLLKKVGTVFSKVDLATTK